MEFHEAKEVLKKSYMDIGGFEFVDENENQVRMKIADAIWTITREDIQEYADFEKQRVKFETTPVECSMCSRNYREQIVRSISYFRRMQPLVFRLRERKIVFGEPSSDAIYVEIGPVSGNFLNYFRFEKNWLERAGARSRWMRTGTTGDTDIRNCHMKPLTIKVYNLSEQSIQSAVRRSSRVIENCLFQLSYLRDVALWLADEWPYKRLPRTRAFRFTEPFRRDQIPLGEVNFNSDIIRFYEFGMSTDIPESRFLAFYQVLEYYFVSTSNERLHEKLSNRIKDPRFTLTSSNLDRLVFDVIKHRHETDEAEMLKNVLEKFVDETELIAFIKAYEKHLGETIYSKRHTVFGVPVEIRLEEGHVFGNVAKHIKEIRNALVHSTDKYERRVRHVPFTKTTEKIAQDIPLIKFLAERVIISSAK